MSDSFLAFEALQSKRRSVRAFLPQAVAPSILDAVFNAASQAPSNCNTQPWLVHVVSGEKLELLRQQLPQRFASGEVSLDFPYDGSYRGEYKSRQHAAAQALYDVLGITREDKELRQQSFMRNFSFFDAPHVALLYMSEDFGLREACDVGMYAQNLMLSMVARGLASCPQTSLGYHAEFLRETLAVPSEQKLLFGISFGYPDPEAAVNRCQTERAPLSDNIQFHA